MFISVVVAPDVGGGRTGTLIILSSVNFTGRRFGAPAPRDSKFVRPDVPPPCLDVLKSDMGRGRPVAVKFWIVGLSRRASLSLSKGLEVVFGVWVREFEKVRFLVAIRRGGLRDLLVGL